MRRAPLRFLGILYFEDLSEASVSDTIRLCDVRLVSAFREQLNVLVMLTRSIRYGHRGYEVVQEARLFSESPPQPL